MRSLLSAAAALTVLLAANSAYSDTYVRGYTRSDGTYVQPHYRSSPDGNVWNNYSTKGNVNPYTGKRGTVDPYDSGYSFGATRRGSSSGLDLFR